ncbi:MAG: RHS repeat protein, partial [bacterium]|nr:RHS repeat protein [bacterium]
MLPSFVDFIDVPTIFSFLSELLPLGGQSSFSYDAQGRLESITDAKAQSTGYGYGYDAQSRLETIDYADGRSVSLSYDADGNLAGYDDCTDAGPCVS